MIPIIKIFEKLFKIPKGPKCIECKSLLIESNCPNMDCPVEVASWIMMWASPVAANISILDDKTTLKLAQYNLVIHPADLYNLSESDWLQIQTMDKIKIGKIMQQLNQSKSMDAKSLLYGFRIKGMDLEMAKNLTNKFQSISKIRELKIESLMTVDRISEETAFNIKRWFKDSFNKKMLKALDKYGFQLD